MDFFRLSSWLQNMKIENVLNVWWSCCFCCCCFLLTKCLCFLRIMTIMMLSVVCKCCCFLERSWATSLVLILIYCCSDPKRPIIKHVRIKLLCVCVIGNSAKKNTKNHVHKFVSSSIFKYWKAEILMWKTNRCSMFVVLFTSVYFNITSNTNISNENDHSILGRCPLLQFHYSCSCFLYSVNLCDTKQQTSQFSNNFVDILAYILEK